MILNINDLLQNLQRTTREDEESGNEKEQDPGTNFSGTGRSQSDSEYKQIIKQPKQIMCQ
jgi:hypothetical protein